MDEELLSRNFARTVQVRGAGDYKVRAFTKAEARQFLKAAEEHRLYALWAVALSMGLRRGEALGLAWSDVDLTAGRLVPRKSLHRVDGELKLEDVKTEGSNHSSAATAAGRHSPGSSQTSVGGAIRGR
jgi:integrase